MTQAAIGVDIGGTRLRAARVRGTVIEARASLPSSRNPEDVIARSLALAAEVMAPGIVALGIGVPGEVEPETGRILSGGNVDLSGVDFAGIMKTRTGLTVAIENDGTMALLGEVAAGAGRGLANVIMLTIGTGIGGAILEQGRVLRGRGSAGQLGHIVIDPVGRACVCGRIGCVETLSSGTAFRTHLVDAGLHTDMRAEELLARSDPVAMKVLTAWATPLRAAIDSLIAICNPDRVVIGGGAGLAAHAALARVPPRPSWFDATVVAAELGDDAGVVGAAHAALDKVSNSADWQGQHRA